MNLGLTHRPDMTEAWRQAAEALRWNGDATLRVASVLLEEAADHLDGRKRMAFGDALLAFRRHPETNLPFRPDLDLPASEGGDVKTNGWSFDGPTGYFWRVSARGLVAIHIADLKEEARLRYDWMNREHPGDEESTLDPSPGELLEWLTMGRPPAYWSASYRRMLDDLRWGAAP